MSTEIQTSLLILTAEIAAVTTVAALLAAGLAWLRGRARLKAAQALRDAAARLPGEGEVVKLERELLGEFARAYLTRDAELLAGLPARLLSLRQAIEASVTPTAPVTAPPVQQAALQALEAERDALGAQVEALARQREQLNQQLETALATINTLVQEYGRGRGMAVTPTAEALLQALAQAGGGGVGAVPTQAAAKEGARVSVSDVEERPGAGKTEEALLDLALGEEVVAADMDVLLSGVEEGRAEASEATGEEDVAVTPMHAEGIDDQALDLSVPVEPLPAPGAETTVAVGSDRDEIDTLDIDALLDAELGRQAPLLRSPPGGEEDLDLARLSTKEGR